MEIDFSQVNPSQRYKLLASLVTPRPIAWVTTRDDLGRVNAAPFSFFNVFGSDPALVAFAPGNKGKAQAGEPAIAKDTARNIRENGEFIIHLVPEELAQAMVQTAASLPAGVDEVQAAGLSTTAARTLQVPRIAEAPVALECREHQTIEIGRNRLVIGVVNHVFVRDGLVEEETFHLRQKDWTPVGRMASPDWYCRSQDLFEMPRPA
ncbi:flavin reductase family protein [Roseibacillus ishigakijimensis]|uniref:Flavin reductase family protein n=1 Tax=Roseibacillus ishigakijimensis TaxID=454146 RepID=A0A934RQU5_9BACT|nr:flavin reductase family protein [Roseibacillus ishigakijimensis]MBK1834207.1 flavin reductase family protein [Roseibacillus ishigakijimensis]